MPGSGSVVNPGSGSELGSGSVVNPGSGSSPGSGSAVNPGSGSAPGSGSVVNPGSGSAPGSGSVVNPGSGSGVGTGGVSLTFKNYELTGTWPQLKAAIPAKASTSAAWKTAGAPAPYTKKVIKGGAPPNTLSYAESCSIADYNEDGIPDVSAGRRWYEGPDFTKEHIFRGGHDGLPVTGDPAELVTGVTDDWACYPFDVNGDGHTDIINIASCDADTTVSPAPKPQAKGTGYWYQNPGPAGLAGDPMWTPHLMHSDMKQEQKGLFDVNGDGKPEIYGACHNCPPGSTKGYFQADWTNPTAGWTYHPVTTYYQFPFGGTGWLHGLGAGDVNGDGKPDLLEAHGIWIQPATPGGMWIHNTTQLTDIANDPVGNHGGSHMFAFDVNGDGATDIVSTDWAHGYGLAWYEQSKTAPGTFTKHYIANQTIPPVFSEPHAMQLVDMDGDGLSDIIIGKERYAHPRGYGDPDLEGTPVLYVFKLIRDPAAPGGARFDPHLVDSEFGVGRQVTVGHVNTDGIPDICVSSKIGLAVFFGQ
jgi:hypothetical protein